jgi:hypothetical protein
MIIVNLILMVAGFWIIWSNYDWKLALGIFLLIWALKIEIQNGRYN